MGNHTIFCCKECWSPERASGNRCADCGSSRVDAIDYDAYSLEDAMRQCLTDMENFRADEVASGLESVLAGDSHPHEYPGPIAKRISEEIECVLITLEETATDDAASRMWRYGR